MTGEPPIVRKESRPGGWLANLLSRGSGLPQRRRIMLYLWVACGSLSMVWIPAGLFLAFKPTTYTSTWSLILPGSGAGHAVSLESVGQASATVSSPYNSHAVDPKVNYKALALSAPVLAAAARPLGMTVDAFGKPRIKLVDQTALIHFRVAGSTPDEALSKSLALYDALQNELERLRADELARRETGIRAMLSGFSDKLRDAQQRILDYQADAQIVSMEQFNELALGLERLRDRVRDLNARRAGLDGQLRALRGTLGTEAEDAIQLLELQHDPLFRELATAWAEASSELAGHRARWGGRHEKVVASRDAERELRQDLFARARVLAPKLDTDTTRLIARGNAEPGLYRKLIELHAEILGLDEEIGSLEASIVAREQILDRSTTDASNLEDLKRRHQVATAVFTTALAKVDIGKSDRFSSYPLVQLLAAPMLPAEPDTLGRNLALLGATAGSLFLVTGLFLAWIRKPFFRRILTNA